MLAIAGGKGGTGKTTTALGLGTVLARRRRDPLLVDGDVGMPNLHLRAGASDDGLARLAAGAPLDAVADEAARFPGVDVLGATQGADLDAALRRLVTDRPVIVDGAAGAAERAVTPLRHADHALVVTRDSPAALTDAIKTIEQARAVGTRVVGTLVSRASDVSDEVSGTLPTDTIYCVPRVDEPVTNRTVRDVYSRILERWINA